MGFGPSISAPTIVGTQIIYPVHLIVIWVLLKVTSIVLQQVVNRLKYLVVKITDSHPFGWYEVPDSDRNSGTVTYTVEDLKEQFNKERRRGKRLRREGYRAVVFGPIYEELTFRGGPFLLAVTLGPPRLPLLVAGSLLWGYFHTRNPPPYRQSTIPVFVGGLLYLYLWIIGLWWLAILLHMANNFIAISMRASTLWWQRRQHSFSPGEEYTVTVCDRRTQPNRFGLYEAYTSDDEILHVVDVEPGETVRVRVATLVGSSGYAYPVSA